MKILHVLPRLDPEAGGPTVVALGLVRALNQRPGIDAEIVTIRGRTHRTLPPPSTNAATVYQGVPVWLLPPGFIRIRSFAPSLAFYRWLNAHIHEYDIIHIHYLFSFTTAVAGVTALWRGKPFVIRPLGQLASWSLRQRRTLKMLWGSCIDYPLMRRAKFIHVTSDQELRDVKAIGITTATLVIPPGIEPQAERSSPTAPATVLFLSRLHPKKRPELVLELLTLLVTEGVEAQVVFAGVGDANYEAELQKQADTALLRGRVSFCGFVSGAAKQQLLSSASVFVLPSQAENFGVAVAEAMASGCPVVVTKEVDIAREIEACGAGIVAGATAREFAAAVRELLEDPERAARMGEAGRRFAAEEWSWPRTAERLEQAYRERPHS